MIGDDRCIKCRTPIDPSKMLCRPCEISVQPKETKYVCDQCRRPDYLNEQAFNKLKSSHDILVKALETIQKELEKQDEFRMPNLIRDYSKICLEIAKEALEKVK